MGAGRITFAEIESFGRLRGLTFMDWELDTLIVMDRAWARATATKDAQREAAEKEPGAVMETDKPAGPRMIPATKTNMATMFRVLMKKHEAKDG